MVTDNDWLPIPYTRIIGETTKARIFCIGEKTHFVPKKMSVHDRKRKELKVKYWFLKKQLDDWNLSVDLSTGIVSSLYT